MYYLINADGKITGSSNFYIQENGCETILLEEGEKLPQQIKEEDISKYKQIEKEAISKRSEYITAELLPPSAFRDLKLAKLEADRVDIENRYNEVMTELVSKYGEEILSELL